MSQLLRVMLAGLVALTAMSLGSAVQAQATIDPVFYGGVVGDPLFQDLLTLQGGVYTFPGPRPSIESLTTSPLWFDNRFQSIRSEPDADNNTATLQVRRGGSAYTGPFFGVSTLVYRQGTTVVGTGEVYTIVFSTADRRDAFLYYYYYQLADEALIEEPPVEDV